MSEKFNSKRFENGSNASDHTHEESQQAQQDRYDEFQTRSNKVAYDYDVANQLVFGDILPRSTQVELDEAMNARAFEQGYATEQFILGEANTNRMYMIAQHIAELRAKVDSDPAAPHLMKDKEDKLEELMDAYTKEAYAEHDRTYANAEEERRSEKEVMKAQADAKLQQKLEAADFIYDAATRASAPATTAETTPSSTPETSDEAKVEDDQASTEAEKDKSKKTVEDSSSKAEAGKVEDKDSKKTDTKADSEDEETAPDTSHLTEVARVTVEVSAEELEQALAAAKEHATPATETQPSPNTRTTERPASMSVTHDPAEIQAMLEVAAARQPETAARIDALREKFLASDKEEAERTTPTAADRIANLQARFGGASKTSNETNPATSTVTEQSSKKHPIRNFFGGIKNKLKGIFRRRSNTEAPASFQDRRNALGEEDMNWQINREAIAHENGAEAPAATSASETAQPSRAEARAAKRESDSEETFEWTEARLALTRDQLARETARMNGATSVESRWDKAFSKASQEYATALNNSMEFAARYGRAHGLSEERIQHDLDESRLAENRAMAAAIERASASRETASDTVVETQEADRPGRLQAIFDRFVSRNNDRERQSPVRARLAGMMAGLVMSLPRSTKSGATETFRQTRRPTPRGTEEVPENERRAA